MNKNWLKVLVMEIPIVFLILATFFLCRFFGMENKEAVAATTIVAISAFIVVFEIVAISAISTALTSDTIADIVAASPKLPTFWVVMSYLATATAIFLPIYLSLN